MCVEAPENYFYGELLAPSGHLKNRKGEKRVVSGEHSHLITSNYKV